MIEIVVTLTDFDRWCAEHFAARCLEFHKGNTEKRYLKNDPLAVDTIGKLGEIAFGKLINQQPDFVARRYGDGGADFLVSGVGIDVKTSSKADKLLVGEGKVKCDVYVLASIQGDSCILHGWSGRDEIRAAPVSKHHAKGKPSNCIMAGKLSPLWDLFDMLHANL